MTSTNTSAAAVSAKLKKLGYLPIQAEDNRRRHDDGLRVRRAAYKGGDILVIIQNFDGTLDIPATIEQLRQDLASVGLIITRTSDSSSGRLASLYVRKAAPKPADKETPGR